MALALRYALRSDVGLLREGNEDSAYAGPRLLAIADGMGGHAAGEVASAVAISATRTARRPGPDRQRRHARRAGRGGRLGQHPRCTRWARRPRDRGHGHDADRAAASPATRSRSGHVGDSRAYLLRDGDLLPDHPGPHLRPVARRRGQAHARRGREPPAAIGDHAGAAGGTDVDPDLAIREARSDDRYLLCSDGLSDVVSDETILDTMPSRTRAGRRAAGRARPAAVAARTTSPASSPTSSTRDRPGSTPSDDVTGDRRGANVGRRSLLKADARVPTQSGGRARRARTATRPAVCTPTAADDDPSPWMTCPSGRWPIVASSSLVVLVLLVAAPVGALRGRPDPVLRRPRRRPRSRSTAASTSRSVRCNFFDRLQAAPYPLRRRADHARAAGTSIEASLPETQPTRENIVRRPSTNRTAVLQTPRTARAANPRRHPADDRDADPKSDRGQTRRHRTPTAAPQPLGADRCRPGHQPGDGPVARTAPELAGRAQSRRCRARAVARPHPPHTELALPGVLARSSWCARRPRSRRRATAGCPRAAHLRLGAAVAVLIAHLAIRRFAPLRRPADCCRSRRCSTGSGW